MKTLFVALFLFTAEAIGDDLPASPAPESADCDDDFDFDFDGFDDFEFGALAGTWVSRALRKSGYRLSRYGTAVSDVLDMRKSQRVDVREVHSVCLALGPYRNLTTLTASTLFLHPDCQVLNHAGDRVYGNHPVDFLQDFSREKLDRFVQFAIQISGKGHRGDIGGSITFSHAFHPRKRHKANEIFEKVTVETRKERIKSLFWKESLRTSNVIRERNVDLADVFEKDARLRFLLPIRHPIDCALSNIRTGHVERFPGLKRSTPPREVVQAILDEIVWFARLRSEFPDRFHYFFEHEICPTMLADLATFLELDPDETWIDNAMAAMKINPGYGHDDSLVCSYLDSVNDKCADFPELSRGLQAFVHRGMERTSQSIPITAG
jgi:hypothetical protein